jgi:hypothetical protein
MNKSSFAAAQAETLVASDIAGGIWQIEIITEGE